MKRRSTPLVSVVIPAKNEAKTIGDVIRAAKKVASRTEVIVIVNGSTDGTAKIARAHMADVYEFDEPLGYDTGRAYGAMKAKGRAILFVDADYVVPARDLRPFVEAVLDRGVDLALNSYPSSVNNRSFRTLFFKQFLNRVHGRRDLLASSMTAVPHALSRRALEKLSFSDLCTPPLAQSRLLAQKARVERVHYVSTSGNRVRSAETRHFVTDLILGDHLEAISLQLEDEGRRGGFTDLERKRERLLFENEEEETPAEPSGSTAVICAHNEESTIAQVVKAALSAGVDRVVVVDNGSQDRTGERARKAGARVMRFEERLGHDIGRALGAAAHPSATYLFLDADIVLHPQDIRPFLLAVEERGVDVALNDLNGLLRDRRLDTVTCAKRVLSAALDRRDLGANSMVAVPHALSHRAVQAIGHEALAVPPKALVRAVLEGLRVEAVHEVNVIRGNPIRKHLHRNSGGNLVAQMILGDTLEGLSELFREKGERGFFGGSRK